MLSPAVPADDFSAVLLRGNFVHDLQAGAKADADGNATDKRRTLEHRHGPQRLGRNQQTEPDEKCSRRQQHCRASTKLACDCGGQRADTKEQRDEATRYCEIVLMQALRKYTRCQCAVEAA